MSEIDDLLKAADRAMGTNNLDAAESIVDSLLMKVKAASDNSDDEYGDPSNPSMDAADNDDDDDGDSEDDEEEDDSEDVSKAYHEYSNAGSPHRMRGEHVRVNRPDTYRISATPPPEGPGKRHKFIARAEFIRDRDGVSRAESLSRARTEFPETYVSYQRHLANRTTRQQALRMGQGWKKRLDL
jgi:hypothetical protein